MTVSLMMTQMKRAVNQNHERKMDATTLLYHTFMHMCMHYYHMHQLGYMKSVITLLYQHEHEHELLV